MKKLLLFACVAGLGLGSCNKKAQCPAYSSTKDAVRVSSPIMAQHATPAPERQ
ncbi:hypothetical protein KLP40_11170 [Hymenobacter sp. NST-14]|uniref:hypothetical protein n=1 Tax=Hymenobacter piscis TaxID=2839984 RepID=UPI001C020163|nr:hypothetical protein [Hymenobacter piscis]MBT9393724.1 hypothetical protein [Hymenobacter piscis]